MATEMGWHQGLDQAALGQSHILEKKCRELASFRPRINFFSRLKKICQEWQVREAGHRENYGTLKAKSQPGRGGQGIYTQSSGPNAGGLHPSYQLGGSPGQREQAPRGRGVNKGPLSPGSERRIWGKNGANQGKWPQAEGAYLEITGKRFTGCGQPRVPILAQSFSCCVPMRKFLSSLLL